MTTETTTKLTYEDYLLFPDDGVKREIIDGELYVSPSANMRHQIVSMNIIRALDGFVHPRQLGHVFAPRADVKLGESDVVEPDVFYLSNDRGHLLTEKNIAGAPDLVVEVLSESNRRYDEIDKRKRYELFGVLEYWIVDPELESVKIYRRAGDKFAPAEIISTETGGEVTTPLLPGFALPVNDVFAE